MMSFLRSAVLVVTIAGSLSASALAQNEQSPIDIRNENIAYSPVLPGLNFTYSHDASLNVVNTGSPDEEATVRANVPAGAGSLVFGGDTYNLLQFHFHIPSEHWLNGHESAMEMHMVHQNAAGNLLVVGRWIEEGAANTTLTPIFADLPPTPADPRAVSNVDLASLLTADLYSFRYDGSLTTPPFTEGVQWVLLTEPLTLSHDQIEAFHGLFPMDNSRLPEPINGRVIQTDDPAYAPAPGGAVSVLTLCGLVATRRRRR